MNKVKQVLTALIITTFIFTSLSVSAQKVKHTKGDVIEVKQKLKKMMSIFVTNTRPYYKEGMSFNSFKIALTGNKNGVMAKEGEALLSKTFSYLENSSNSKRIINNDSGQEIAAALLFSMKYNKKNSMKNGDLILFGNSTGNTFPSSFMKTSSSCKWYQLGCWWDFVFGEYAEIAMTVLVAILNP